jgi:translation initiation factor 3 subunit L
MTYKHKMHAVDSDGKIVSSADIDFYIVEVNAL